MVASILNKHLAEPSSVLVSDISQSRREYLVQTYGILTTDNNQLTTDGYELIVLAIKPQNLAPVMAELKGQFNPGQLVVSIIAGTGLSTLCDGLNHQNIVRAMPNTPAQIGEGMTVWTASDKVTGTQKDMTHSVLGAMGTELYVENEDYIDMATAISGSGPAYLFLFAESLIDAAQEIGFSRDIAKKLVLETINGAGNLIRESGKEPADLRRMVTSPGGTTAEALARLSDGGFSGLLNQAVNAAYRKAKELGQN